MNPQGTWTLDLLSFALGFIAAAYLGHLVQQMKKRTITMEKRDRGMDVSTTQTPRDIFVAASKAFFQWVCLLLLLLASIAAISVGVWWLMSQ